MNIEADYAAAIFDQVEKTVNTPLPASDNIVEIKNRISNEQYVDYVQKLQKHIARGDCYEVNFCQEFFAEKVIIDPLFVYTKSFPGIA